MSTGQAVERQRNPVAIEEHERATLERDAKMLAGSGLVPEYFRGKPNDVLIAGLALRDVGVRLSVTTIGMVYVVKGKPGFMAQLQIAIAHKHGIEIQFDQAECNETTATCQIKDRNGWHRVTFTMADAIRAKLPAQNPTYGTYPDRMLLARSVTKAIGMYFPEIKLGFADPGDVADYDDTFASEDAPLEAEADAEPGPLGSASAPLDDLGRRLLVALIGTLDGGHIARLKAAWAAVRPKVPAVANEAFTGAHADQVLVLIGGTKTEPEDLAGDVATGGGGGEAAASKATYAPGEEPFE